jgi:hypothetical protein
LHARGTQGDGDPADLPCPVAGEDVEGDDRGPVRGHGDARGVGAAALRHPGDDQRADERAAGVAHERLDRGVVAWLVLAPHDGRRSVARRGHVDGRTEADARKRSGSSSRAASGPLDDKQGVALHLGADDSYPVAGPIAGGGEAEWPRDKPRPDEERLRRTERSGGGRRGEQRGKRNNCGEAGGEKHRDPRTVATTRRHAHDARLHYSPPEGHPRSSHRRGAPTTARIGLK